jgi:hypothetical protein
LDVKDNALPKGRKSLLPTLLHRVPNLSIKKLQSKCDTLNANQQELKSSLKDTNEKLDRLLNVMTAYEEVIDNKESFEHLLMIVKYPKAFILLLVGCLSLVGGAFGNKIWDFIKMLLSAL